ncbi:hypothetical protein K438DRAFT_2057913 [Mycena galopus ATCC 62051]|nr:hypothetical protein K438DRAFT_2057913 [Mycena galopus ATCC 62051]
MSVGAEGAEVVEPTASGMEKGGGRKGANRGGAAAVLALPASFRFLRGGEAMKREVRSERGAEVGPTRRLSVVEPRYIKTSDAEAVLIYHPSVLPTHIKTFNSTVTTVLPGDHEHLNLDGVHQDPSTSRSNAIKFVDVVGDGDHKIYTRIREKNILFTLCMVNAERRPTAQRCRALISAAGRRLRSACRRFWEHAHASRGREPSAEPGADDAATAAWDMVRVRVCAGEAGARGGAATAAPTQHVRCPQIARGRVRACIGSEHQHQHARLGDVDAELGAVGPGGVLVVIQRGGERDGCDDTGDGGVRGGVGRRRAQNKRERRRLRLHSPVEWIASAPVRDAPQDTAAEYVTRWSASPTTAESWGAESSASEGTKSSGCSQWRAGDAVRARALERFRDYGSATGCCKEGMCGFPYIRGVANGAAEPARAHLRLGTRNALFASKNPRPLVQYIVEYQRCTQENPIFPTPHPSQVPKESSRTFFQFLREIYTREGRIGGVIVNLRAGRWR